MVLVVGIRVHFTYVNAVVAAVAQILYPGPRPGVVILQGSGIMGKVSGEQACSGGTAGRCRYVALLEGDSLFDETIGMRRVEVRVAKGRDRVVSLLVRYNEDDVGTFFRH